MNHIAAFSKEGAALALGCAQPLLWFDKKTDWPKLVDGGTCFFLAFEDKVIGVTANHVVADFEAAVTSDPNTVCQLNYGITFDLLGAVVARDTASDIATFELPASFLGRVKSAPLDCRGSWPPPLPMEPIALSICGFPLALRSSTRDGTVSLPSWSGLTLSDGVSSDQIVTTYDPAIAERPKWSPGLPPLGFNMSGCSGGPVLAWGAWDGVKRWFPVALIREGPRLEQKQGQMSEFDMILMRRIDVVQPDGTIARRQGVGGWLPT